MQYGVTIGSKGPALDPRAIAAMKDLGMTCLRFQAPLALLHTSFAIYDDAVQKCNMAGIDLCLTIKHAPDPGYPSPQEATSMAVALAQRYDGKHGYGEVQVIEIGNEDYGYADFGALADVMTAVVPAVAAINPNVLVVPGATLQRNTDNLKQAVTTMLQKAGKFIRILNVHTYFGIPSTGPHVPEDGSVPNVPSFPQYIQAVKDVCVSCGYPNMPIWDTEFGFPISAVNHPGVPIFSQADQWTHLKYCYDQGRALGVERMYVFTLGFGGDGMSLVDANGGKTIAYQQLKAYIAQNAGAPVGGNSGGGSTGPSASAVAQAVEHLQEALKLLGA